MRMCGKGRLSAGNSHANNVSARRFEPNLQRVRAVVNGGITPACLHAVPALRQGRQGGLKGGRPFPPPTAPKAIGPYSQAVRAGSCCSCRARFRSTRPPGSLVDGDIAAQTRRVFGEYRRDPQGRRPLVRRRRAHDRVPRRHERLRRDKRGLRAVLSEPYPARATVQVARLPKDARVEIDVIA